MTYIRKVLNLGILTSPSQTYFYKEHKKIKKVKFDKLPPDVKMKQGNFAEFMDGGLFEVLSLKNQLSDIIQVELALLIDNNGIVTEKMNFSPNDMENGNINYMAIPLKEWLGDRDILISIFKKDEMLKLIKCNIINNYRIIVCSARSSEQEIRKQFPNLELFCIRKGVARIGRKSLMEIKDYIEMIA